jgi:hypothetical protein
MVLYGGMRSSSMLEDHRSSRQPIADSYSRPTAAR